MRAAKNGHIDIVKLLLGNGADTTGKRKAEREREEGGTIIHFTPSNSAEASREQIMERMIELQIYAEENLKGF